MTTKELVKLTSELIELPSDLEHKEHAVAKKIVEVLKREGIRGEIDYSSEGRPNVLAVLEGEKPGKTLLFNGHTDVVPAGEGWTKKPWKALEENGRIYGRGSCDMKGGIAAMMAATIQLKRDNYPFNGKLVLFFNADEERSNIGMRHFLNNPIDADYAVVGEATNLTPCIGHRGNGRIRLTTKGKAGHCARVEKPDNALYKLARIITALEEHAKEVEKRASEVGNGSLTVTMAGGGTAPNIVPDYGWLELDRRILPGETKESVIEEVKVWAEQASGEKIMPNMYQYFPAFYIPADHELVDIALRSVAGVTGEKVTPELFQAGTEAPFLAIDLKCPTIILGPGSLEQAHQPDEYVEINQLTKAKEIYQAMAIEILK